VRGKGHVSTVSAQFRAGRDGKGCGFYLYDGQCRLRERFELRMDGRGNYCREVIGHTWSLFGYSEQGIEDAVNMTFDFIVRDFVAAV
jgi:hypothetical protein